MQIGQMNMKFYIWKCDHVGELLYFSNITKGNNWKPFGRWTDNIEYATLYSSKTTALQRMKMLDTPVYVNFLSEDEMMI